MGFLFLLAAGFWLFNFTGVCVGAWIMFRHYSRRNKPSMEGVAWEPLTILKPLKGMDSDLRDNLRSFFHLDYPYYEIIFSIADPADPACEVVNELIKENPEVKSQLIVGDWEVGPNPKVNNLLRSYAAAETDLILIADSNVRVKPPYLKFLVSEMKPGVGIVTGSVAGREVESIAGALEATYLGGFARWMHIASKLGVPLVMGKTMLFRRSVANKFGGLKALVSYIAEDFWMGQKVKGAGLRVVLMRQPIHQHLGNYSLKSFWSRHIRWGRIRKLQAPAAFAIEPLGSTVLSGLLGALAVSHWMPILFVPFLVLHLAVIAMADFILIHRLGDGISPRMVMAWLLRELLILPLWLHTLASNRIAWRGRPLRLHLGGTVSSDESFTFEDESHPVVDTITQIL